MLRISTCSLIGLAVFSAGTAFAQVPTVTHLGTDLLPQSTSNDGKVVAGISIRENSPGIFRWTSSSGVRLIGNVTAGKPDVSADGTTIAGTLFTDRLEAAFWKPSTGWVPLSATDLIPALPGWDTASQAISANGRRLAGGTTPPPVDYGWVRAFSFNPDTWTDRFADFGWSELPLAGKGGIASALGTSNNGRVQVGMASDRGGSFFAVRWIDGRMQELRDADGERLGGESVACNSDCSVIAGGGGGSSAVNPVLAWRLRVGKKEPACYFEPLKGGPRPALRHYVYDTNEAGDVIVGSYYYDVFDPPFIRNVAKGFLWLADARGGTLVDLQEYLVSLGQPALRNLVDVVVVGVSGDGRYLVGYGDDAQGLIRGWRIDFGKTPRPSAALPPSSSHTQCPVSAAPETERSASTTPAVSPAWMPTEAAFRTTDGQHYHINWRGPAAYAGTQKDAVTRQQLISLGGDRYYDLALRATLGLARDSAGKVVAVRVSKGRSTAVWDRESS